MIAINNKSIKFKNVKTSNLEMSAKMLVEKWKMNPKEKEITVMRVIIEGVKNKKNIKYIFDLYDEFDEENMHSEETNYSFHNRLSIFLYLLELYC